MSRTYLIPIGSEGTPLAEEVEFSNSWGGAARIWDSLFKHYLNDAKKPYDSWMQNQDALWQLAKDEGLSRFIRAVHAFTFDRFYVLRKDFPQFCADLRSFKSMFPTGGVCHLESWAAAFEAMPERVHALGLHATSVSDNLWWAYDEDEDDEEKPVHISKGHDVYAFMARVEKGEFREGLDVVTD